jgi:CO dehydrogenase maturation factor
VPEIPTSAGPTADPRSGLRVVVTGKGGVGKTTLVATLARLLARDGRRVLAVDGDAQLNLAAALGIPKDEAEGLVPLSHDADYVTEKTGARSGEGWGLMFRLNPDVDDVVDRFGRRAPDDVRLLAMGTLTTAGTGCLCPENTLLAETIRAIGLREGEAIVMDTQAGVEHFGRAIARGFGHAVVVTDPTYSGVRVALAASGLAIQLGIPNVHLVVNRTRGQDDRDRVERGLGEIATLYASTTWLPDDERVRDAEPAVDALFEPPDDPFLASVRQLRDALVEEGPGHPAGSRPAESADAGSGSIPVEVLG